MAAVCPYHCVNKNHNKCDINHEQLPRQCQDCEWQLQDPSRRQNRRNCVQELQTPQRRVHIADLADSRIPEVRVGTNHHDFTMLALRYLHIWIKATNTSIPRTHVFRKRWVKHLDLVKTILYGQKIVWQCYYLPWLFIVGYCQIVSCPPVNDSLCTCQQV